MEQRFRAVLLILFMTISSSVASAFSDQFVTRTWQKEDGLPSNSLYSIIQSADGYLWLATNAGVYRFDGDRFLSTTGDSRSTTESIAHPIRLFLLADGTLCVATRANDLLKWHESHFVLMMSGIQFKGAVDQVVENRTSIFVKGGQRMAEINDQGVTTTVEDTPMVAKLFQDDTDYWRNHGRRTQADQIPHLRDSKDRLWTGLPAGLSVELPGVLGNQVVAPPESYQELTEDNEGNIWAATENHGLVRVSEATVQLITPREGLSNQNALAVLEDRNHDLWVATKDGGLNRLSNNKVVVYPLFQDIDKEKITALGQDQKGTIWAATSNGRVYRKMQDQFEAFTDQENTGPIDSILCSRSGDLLLGGDRGLFRYVNGARAPEHLSLKVSEVTAMAEGINGQSWLGTANGQIYTGTWDNLNLVPGATFPRRRSISAIEQDQDGIVWVATTAGLLLGKAGSYQLFTRKEGLPDDQLTGVVDDQQGHLWVGTPTGIFHLSKGELLNWSHDQKDLLNFEMIDRSDGLTSLECNSGASPSAIRCQDGTVCFPTIDGLAMIRTDRFPRSLRTPQVVIEDCRLNGIVLPPPFTVLRVRPGPARLDISYTALSLTAPEKVRFRIKLNGADRDWKDVGNRRSISYSQLRPGYYRFQVIATSGNGVWNETGAEVSIQVLPHIWERLWFRILSLFTFVTLVAAAIWFLARWRLKKRLASVQLEMTRQAERMRIAQDLHDDLGSRLTEISLLAGLAADASDDDDPKGSVLPDLVDKTRGLAAVLDEVVWAVNPYYDSISSLADYLVAYAADLLSAAEISARFILPPCYPPTILDQTQRHSLFLAAREGLNNAVKYSGASLVEIRISIEKDQLQLVIKDDGCGFDPKTTALGNGLTNMSNRLTKLGGRCQITSEFGKGTEVLFEVSLGNAHRSPG
jgi:signal transduction histidine kinase/ligand-binding sensor domain-containing protein